MNYMRFFFVLLILMLLPVPVYADAEPEARCGTALLEARSGMLLSGENADLPLPAGSQTKLMTVYLAAEAIAEGRLSLTEAITAPPSAEGAAGATIWLRSGEKMTASDLLKGIIIGNANDACIALACRISGSEANFVADMNAAAFSLDMRSTRFADCTGLSAESVTTAHELGLLCRALLQYPELTPFFTTWRDFLRGDATELVSENRLTRNYEGLRGFKAGHGEASGYTLAIAAERENLCMIAVILGGTDDHQRFSDAKSMLAEGFSGYYVTTPDFSAEFMRPLPVRAGTASSVTAEAEGLLSVAAPKGESISSVLILPKYLEAPVKRGDQIGTAAFYCGDTLLYEAALTAAEDVPRRSFLETLRMLLVNMFK